MKYYFVSDIHGFYDKLQRGLDNELFNKKTDCLVVVGDSFDRGPDSLKVLQFIMRCPRRIILWGNHDFRLYELLCTGSRVCSYDIDNGVPATLASFMGLKQPDKRPSMALLSTWIQMFIHDEHFKSTFDLLREYWRESCVAIEFDGLIATHAWLPLKSGSANEIDPDWRIITSYTRWNDATWENSLDRILNIETSHADKTLLIGHWSAENIRACWCGTAGVFDDFPIYYYNRDGIALGAICIDGCAADPEGKVNACPIDFDTPPVKYYCHLI